MWDMVGKLEVAWDGSFAVGSWDLRRNSAVVIRKTTLMFDFFIFHNARDVILPID